MNKMHSRKLKAAITVEASFCVPVFFFVMFSLIYEFNILFDVNNNYVELFQAADDYAVYGTKADTLTSFLKGRNTIIWSENGGYKVCFMKYKKRIPFAGGVFGKQRFYHQLVINDYSGRSMCPKENASEEEVYITDTGKVYHTHADCTYLNPSIKRISQMQLDNIRNQAGGKYKRCEYCFKSGDKTGNHVYITDYGDRYHLSEKCSGLKRSIRKVKLSKIGKMSECNKCKERG